MRTRIVILFCLLGSFIRVQAAPDIAVPSSSKRVVKQVMPAQNGLSDDLSCYDFNSESAAETMQPDPKIPSSGDQIHQFMSSGAVPNLTILSHMDLPPPPVS
jgi:hypothetical protein